MPLRWWFEFRQWWLLTPEEQAHRQADEVWRAADFLTPDWYSPPLLGDPVVAEGYRLGDQVQRVVWNQASYLTTAFAAQGHLLSWPRRELGHLELFTLALRHLEDQARAWLGPGAELLLFLDAAERSLRLEETRLRILGALRRTCAPLPVDAEEWVEEAARRVVAMYRVPLSLPVLAKAREAMRRGRHELPVAQLLALAQDRARRRQAGE